MTEEEHADASTTSQCPIVWGQSGVSASWTALSHAPQGLLALRWCWRSTRYIHSYCNNCSTRGSRAPTLCWSSGTFTVKTAVRVLHLLRKSRARSCHASPAPAPARTLLPAIWPDFVRFCGLGGDLRPCTSAPSAPLLILMVPLLCLLSALLIVA